MQIPGFPSDFAARVFKWVADPMDWISVTRRPGLRRHFKADCLGPNRGDLIGREEVLEKGHAVAGSA